MTNPMDGIGIAVPGRRWWSESGSAMDIWWRDGAMVGSGFGLVRIVGAVGDFRLDQSG